MASLEEATPLNFRFFLHVSIFPFFGSTSKVHPNKNRSPKISKQFFQVTNLIVSSGQKNLTWAREVWLEENDRIRSEADFWRFGLRHLHRLMLEGWCWFWIGFLLSKMLGWLKHVSWFIRFCPSFFWMLFVRLTCDGKQMQNMGF